MISIIIPIYNAGSTIVRCIDSILAQTYKDWELLLIDDGSTDKSGEICDEYPQKDSRINVFHKINGGVSSARNIGLSKANGEWITFIDADDYLLPKFLERLIAYHNYDLVMSGSSRFGNSHNTHLIPEDREYDIRSYVEHIFRCDPLENEYMSCVSYPWGKILRTDIIRKNHLEFNTNMKLSEDTCFMLQYLEYVNKVKYIVGGDYMYCVSSAPKAHLRMNAEEYINHVEGIQSATLHIANKYCVSSSKYRMNMCSMYYEAFLNNLRGKSYLELRKQLQVFKQINTVPLNSLMKNMTFQKRYILKGAMKNSFFLYLILSVCFKG